MKVGIGQGRQRNLVWAKGEPPRPGADGCVDSRPAAGGDNPAAGDRHGPDPAKPAGALEGRDPPVDDELGGGHASAPRPPLAGAGIAVGPARNPASASPASPAPSPAASAIRALGAPSVPATIAPARTQVAPPPGKA